MKKQYEQSNISIRWKYKYSYLGTTPIRWRSKMSNLIYLSDETIRNANNLMFLLPAFLGRVRQFPSPWASIYFMRRRSSSGVQGPLLNPTYEQQGVCAIPIFEFLFLYILSDEDSNSLNDEVRSTCNVHL